MTESKPQKTFEEIVCLRATPPRHAGNYQPESWYWRWRVMPNEWHSDVRFKCGHGGTFEIGFYCRWPTWALIKKQLEGRCWIRIVSNKE